MIHLKHEHQEFVTSYKHPAGDRVHPSPESPRGAFVATVKENRHLCTDHFRLILSLRGFPKNSPGQVHPTSIAAILTAGDDTATESGRTYQVSTGQSPILARRPPQTPRSRLCRAHGAIFAAPFPLPTAGHGPMDTPKST